MMNVMATAASPKMDAIKENIAVTGKPKEQIIFDKTRERALRLVKEDSLNLNSLPLLFKNDLEVVSVAVEKFGYSLRHASPELRNHKETVLLACKNWPHALKYASDELKDSDTFLTMLFKIKGAGVALQYASERITGERNVVYEAIQSYDGALRYAHEDIREDQQFLARCARSNGNSLRGASELLSEHPEHKEEWMALLDIAGEWQNKHQIGKKTKETNKVIVPEKKAEEEEEGFDSGEDGDNIEKPTLEIDDRDDDDFDHDDVDD